MPLGLPGPGISILMKFQTMTAGEIANNFDVARPTISKHIQILKECDVIESNQQGREIHYKIKIDKMKEIDKWLEQFKKIWESRFNQLDNVLNQFKNKQS